MRIHWSVDFSGSRVNQLRYYFGGYGSLYCPGLAGRARCTQQQARRHVDQLTGNVFR